MYAYRVYSENIQYSYGLFGARVYQHDNNIIFHFTQYVIVDEYVLIIINNNYSIVIERIYLYDKSLNIIISFDFVSVTEKAGLKNQFS